MKPKTHEYNVCNVCKGLFATKNDLAIHLQQTPCGRVIFPVDNALHPLPDSMRDMDETDEQAAVVPMSKILQVIDLLNRIEKNTRKENEREDK